jgi:1-acyl-sn-glycerol-3-phosphate acyltransferase
MTSPASKLHIITIAQILCYILMVIPLRLLARARRDIDRDISRLRPGSLVVANHQWFLDPFVVLAHLPLLTFLTLLPIRFPVKHDFMSKKRWQWLRLVGAYDLGNTPRDKMIGLCRARQYVRSSTTVFLFPEGQVSRTGHIGELQRGIEYLITEDTPLMFVRLHGFHRRDLGMLWEPRSIVFMVPQPSRKVTRHDIQKILDLPSHAEA